jgi:hypothetical protein
LHYNPSNLTITTQECLADLVAKGKAYFDLTQAMMAQEDDLQWLQPHRCAVLNKFNQPATTIRTECTRPRHEAFYDKRDQAMCLLAIDHGMRQSMTLADINHKAKELMRSE